MNKKILIGSIAIVFLILLVSFKPTAEAKSLKDSLPHIYENTAKKINALKNTNLIEFLLAIIQDIIAPIIFLIFAILGSLG